MRKQVAYTFYIGSKYRGPAFEQEVIRSASRICGGCTVIPGKGYWMSDGAEKGVCLFKGDMEEEHVFILKLTSEWFKSKMTYNLMQAAIVDAAKKHGMQTDWVHVEAVEMQGMHFSVKEALA